ncbi:MAG TPA: class I SAM-dependent methyltransferase [Ktedonobacterales bacterium]
MGWLSRLFRRRSAERAGDFGSGVDAPSGMIAGRVRARGVPYNLPRDLEEMNRLDFQHYLFRAALRGNYAAPIAYPRSILDVGTGTGRWAREMAQNFPQARVVGLDINQPPADVSPSALTEPAPPNYAFYAGNVLEGLPFPDQSFDFTHMRLLVSAILHDRWPLVIHELARVTAPGGWIESVEPTLPTAGGPQAEQLMDWIRAISLRRNVEIEDATRVAGLLRDAGLSAIATRTIEIPCGSWGGRVGKMMMTDYFAGVQAVRGVIVAQGLATETQFDQTLTQALRDIDSRQYRCNMPVHIAIGQRV